MSDAFNYEDQVNSEYMEEMNDVLNEMDVIMDQVAAGSEEGIGRYKILISKLNGLCIMGRHTDFPLLNVTTHRLYNYLQGLDRPTQENVLDVQNFADIMRGIIRNDITHEGYNFAEFVRSLPVRRPAELEDVEHLDVEVMVVENRRSTARIFERELLACGYRVHWVQSSIEALSFAVKMKPDMVMASMELDEINGIDLACALSAMPKTKDIPFALLTSYKKDDPRLADLPETAATLNKGKGFGDDLADVLERFEIT